MKKTILTSLSLAAVCSSMAQQARQLPQLSPLTRQYISAVQQQRDSKGMVPGYVYKHFQGQDYISALIKTGNQFDAASLQQNGVLAGTKAGNIWTVQIPVQQVAAFTHTAGISYIQLDEPLHKTLDSVRKYTHVDSVQNGTGLVMPFLGKDVVVGVIDVGFDFTSPTLRDTSGAKYRVKRVWEQKTLTGTPPSGYIYGTELTDSAAMWSAGTDNNIESHGMHVTGIAAGSGYGSTSNKSLRGMAPEADVVLVGILPEQSQWVSTGGTDIIDGVHYIYQYAASVGKPAVVNLSWVASLGPHDGTSLFSEAIENLTGAGKIFVTAAGNDGASQVHLKKTFTAADTVVNTFPTYDVVKKTWVDIWGDTGKNFCVKVTLYNGSTAGNTTGFVCLDDTLHHFALIGSNSDTCFVDITGSSAEFNMKTRSFISLYSKVADSICVTVKATDGTINMWNHYVEAPTAFEGVFTNGGKSWAVAGDTLQSISDNATGVSAIAVGAYTTKIAWRTTSNQNYGYGAGIIRGNIASFSSVGPSEDNRMKPDITAPGFGVASSVNSFDSSYLPGGANYVSSVVAKYHYAATNRDYCYAMMAGTSMASPAAAGIVALLLQANPALTPAQVRDILSQTAIHDNYTTATPGNTWGSGKINAYQALKRALQSNDVHGVNQHTLACQLFPNPNNGNFNIGFLGERSERLQVDVYDVTGHRVFTDGWQVAQGYNTRSISVQSMAKGVYIVKVSAATGNAALRMIVE